MNTTSYSSIATMTSSIKRCAIGAIIFRLFSCEKHQSSNYSKVNDNYRPNATVAQITDKLNSSFSQNKPDSLESFFADWNKSVSPNTNGFVHQNDTIAAVFSVYKAFYKPFNLLVLGKWEWGNNLNSRSKYAVLQNKIYFLTLPADGINYFGWKSLKRDSISNFRPLTDLPSDKVLYLTTEYSKSINIFLGDESTSLGEGNIMNPSRPTGNSKKRYNALVNYIPLLHGHWKNYWHLETHPEVSLVLFNKTLTEARVYFRVGYEGGVATLMKVDVNWVIKASESTWIE